MTIKDACIIWADPHWTATHSNLQKVYFSFDYRFYINNFLSKKYCFDKKTYDIAKIMSFLPKRIKKQLFQLSASLFNLLTFDNQVQGSTIFHKHVSVSIIKYHAVFSHISLPPTYCQHQVLNLEAICAFSCSLDLYFLLGTVDFFPCMVLASPSV